MTAKVQVGYKFVTADLKSKNGECQWIVGEWKHHDGELAMCESGLHASPTPLDSLQYTYGDRWFMVEAKGILGKVEGDKFVCSDMKLTQEIPVSKVLVPFAIACARRCYANWKKEYPKDDRVMAAILAAEKCLADPSKENIKAAWSAESAAWSAASTASAAWSAAWSTASTASAAWSAARSAESAAWSTASAARSAESAERSAESAARSAESAAWSTASAERSAESAAWSTASAERSAARSAARSQEKQWQQRLLHRLIHKALKEQKQ